MNDDKRTNNTEVENKVYIDLFYHYLVNQHLAVCTIERHMKNIKVYINEYLKYREITEIQRGCYVVNNFFGWWYPGIHFQISKHTVNDYCATIKKFYYFMLENNNISQDDYDYLISEIKDKKYRWYSLCYDF